MDTSIFISWTPAIRITPAFFPARAVGDEIGNYVIASAGTITSKDNTDITGNMNTATESVCPKGWTLPSTKQIDANNDAANFEPVLGGNYYNSAPQGESTYGFWWAVEAYNNSYRYRLGYNGNKHNLSSYYYIRPNGLYIRCVSEEKTVTDLTYLQDMTGEIANNTL